MPGERRELEQEPPLVAQPSNEILLRLGRELVGRLEAGLIATGASRPLVHAAIDDAEPAGADGGEDTVSVVDRGPAEPKYVALGAGHRRKYTPSPEDRLRATRLRHGGP